jgi:hypothetical protein
MHAGDGQFRSSGKVKRTTAIRAQGGQSIDRLRVTDRRSGFHLASKQPRKVDCNWKVNPGQAEEMACGLSPENWVSMHAIADSTVI